MLHFIAVHGSLDQPSAQQFTKYIGQQSPAALLESALLHWQGCGCSYGSSCDSHWMDPA